MALDLLSRIVQISLRLILGLLFGLALFVLLEWKARGTDVGQHSLLNRVER